MLFCHKIGAGVASMLDLPEEILVMICEFIIRPNDLKALCLVNRKISLIATARLYRDIELPYDLSDPDWKSLESLYNNRGLQYVRHLQIGRSEVGREFGEYNVCHPLQALLSCLRRDSLETLEFGSHGLLSCHHMKSLWRTQKRLTNIQLEISTGTGSLRMEDLVDEDVDELRSLRSVRHLRLRIGALPNLTLIADLLASLSYNDVDDVTIELKQRLEESGDPILDDSLTRRLDHHLFPRYLPFNVRKVTLISVDMPRSKTVQLDSWPCLTELAFLSCHNVVPVLNDFRWPKLTSFVCRDGILPTAEDPRERLPAINTMLARFETLRTLILELQEIEEDDPGIDHLARSLPCHAHNLESLIIRLARFRLGFVDHHETHEAIFNAIRRCKRLDELALWVTWRQVVSTCELALKDLKNLSLLNIISPIPLETQPHHGPGRQHHQRRFQRSAEEIFQATHSYSSHPIIVFGETGQFGEDDEDDWRHRSMSFKQAVHSTTIRDGTDLVTAEPLKDKDLKYVFPNSRLLPYRYGM